VAREDEAESDVALICTGIKRIVDRKQLSEPGPPIAGRRGCPVRANAKPACHPLEAGSGSEPDSCALVAQDHETVWAARRSGAQAKAQPSRVLGYDEMVFVPIAMIGERFKAGWKGGRGYICCRDHDHVGRGLGRPQRRTGAWVGVRGVGKAQPPTPGQTLLFGWSNCGIPGDSVLRVCVIAAIGRIALQELLRKIRIVMVSVLICGRW
jgi:hypothetical protein